MAKKAEAKWPPRGWTCGHCGFSSPYVSRMEAHIAEEHGGSGRYDGDVTRADEQPSDAA